MLLYMMGIRKYLNNQNWNIGFAQVTPEELIRSKKISDVKWMKHPYKDRFFADPFILSVDNDYIIVLVEELIFGEKGTLVWLKIDRKTLKLQDRKLLLQLDTHLSYPQIVRKDDSLFIIPENSESGKLTVYSFDEKNISLNQVGVISDEPLTDATLLSTEDGIYMMATKLPNSQGDAYLYKYNSSEMKFCKISTSPVIEDRALARMGGAFFKIDGNVFRPAQDCEHGYGKALTICQVDSFEPIYQEHKIFRIEPCTWKYNLGLHTLNFDKDSGLAVIDSYGYLYPILGRVLMALHQIKRCINGRTNH